MITTGTYSTPTPLPSTLELPWATVHASISDRGTIRLEQDGKRVHLTPGELRALVALVEA